MKEKKVLITIVTIMTISIITGYLTVYLTYEPKIKSYETQVSSLSNRISKLQSNLTYYELQVIKLKTENSILQSKVISHNDSNNTSRNNIDTNCSELRSQLETAKEQLNLLLEVPQDYYAMNEKFKQYNNTYAGLETFYYKLSTQQILSKCL